MREIKFRAWYFNEMWYSDFMISRKGQVYWWDSNHQEYSLMIPKENIELMQFTGLKDKDGKEIYEGDVIKGIWGENEIDFFKVVFKKGGFYGEGESGDYVFDDYQILEIMGNVYENPELMEEEDGNKN